MLIIIYLIVFILIFQFLRKKNKLIYIVYIDAFFQVFTGNINSEFTILLEPSDWVTLIIFLNIYLFSEQYNRSYFSKMTWIDKLISLYFVFVLLIPGLINLFVYKVNITFVYFIPIRFWLVYRNYYCLLEESKFGSNNKFNIERMLISYLIFGMISAIITIARFFPLPWIEQIENIWPVYYENEQIKMSNWGRLSGTMSGTNGTGNYFCFLTIISLLILNKKKVYSIIFIIVFGTSVILSGSFSSIAALSFILLIYFRKNILKPSFLIFIITAISVYLIINKTQTFKDKFTYRVETGYLGNYKKGILPSNLVARFGYWETFVKISIEEGRILYGLGPGGFFNYSYGRNNIVNQNAESFYMRILNESGIFALIFVLVFFYKIYNKLRNKVVLKKFESIKKLMLLGIIILLVAGVANETLYYGANTSIFGVFLSITGFIYSYSKTKSELNLHNNHRM
jgi:hypothetical protein